MPKFPYFGFPNTYYRNYRYYPNYNYQNINNFSNASTNQSFIPKKENSSKKESEKHNVSEEEAFFDLFGIKLHFDDILLLSLIFFLYNEGVKDDGLFMALVLLLLT